MSPDEQIELNAEQVADYLKRHPGFFALHEELLTEIRVPHDSGTAISLIERQVGVLRERNVELRNRLHKLLDVARENDQLFEKSRGLILSLLEKNDIASLVQTLVQELKTRFGSEHISFLLFDAAAENIAPAQNIPLKEAQECISSLVRGQRAIAGQLRRDELAFLFGDAAPHVTSCAVVPVALDRPLGLLAIGSSNPEHFKSSMDTLFITHIGDVLARCLSSLLAASAERQLA